MGIRSKIAALCCCLLFIPAGLSHAETQASAAVQPFAGAVETKPEETEELETRSLELEARSISVSIGRVSGDSIPMLFAYKWKSRVVYQGRVELTFLWQDLRDLGAKKYRFRVTDDRRENTQDDPKKGKWILLDEYTKDTSFSFYEKELGVGHYTIKVWAYDEDGQIVTDDYGNEAIAWLELEIYYFGKYSYSLIEIEDLRFTPGEAITRQHATGDKSETLVAYDAVLPEVSSLPMTKLTVGGEALEAGCSGARFTASIAGDTMTLYTSGAGDWQIRQSALGTLKKSGIRILRLMDGNGETRELSTGLAFAGRQYALLRAKGLVSKDFLLTAEEGGWRVEADGKTFDLAEDGTLFPRAGETEEEGAA